MEPNNDHERIIALAVDKKFLQNPGDRRQSILRDYLDIALSLEFVMSASDSQFLVTYLNWQLTHPVIPLPKFATA
jgi:hypothetical protein